MKERPIGLSWKESLEEQIVYKIKENETQL